MTATSASVQKKGQWLRLDARPFSRQLGNNTVEAQSTHAAGMEALPTGEGPCRGKEAGGEGLSSAGRPLHLCHPLGLHGEGIDPRSHCTLLLCRVQYQMLLSAATAALLAVHHAGLGVSVSPRVPGYGRSGRALEVQQPQGGPSLAALPRPPFPHIFYLQVKHSPEWQKC